MMLTLKSFFRPLRPLSIVSLALAVSALGACSDDATPGGTPDGPTATTPDAGSPDAGSTGFVYIETNDPAGNAILAFARAADGTLTPVANGKTATGGAGITAGADQHLGPLDSDHDLVLSADRQFLFAVNSGDDTVAVLHTSATGALTPVSGSPFPTGGKNPVSIGQVGQTLYVVNKEADGNATASYTALTLAADGKLSPVDGVKVATTAGGSPAIAYPADGGKLLFGTQFLDGSRGASAPAGQIDSFVIGQGGTLTPAAGAPFALPADQSAAPPVALDLISHPTQKVLYVGFVTRSQLGVYSYDDSGVLTFLRAVPNSGTAICWFLVNSAGTHLYSVNSGSGTLSLYDISDAEHPSETSHIQLKQAMSGPPFTDAMGNTEMVTSQPFQLAFDPSQAHIYVVSQRATTNADDATGNYLHTLSIAADGSLSEPGTPIDLSTLGVPASARPKGVAVF